MVDVEQRLSGWLRNVDLAPGATRQQAIVAAARELARATVPREVLDLVYLAHQGDSSNATGRVSEAARNQDETWEVRAGDLEASLTAATAVVFAMAADSAGAVPFALAVGAAEYLGLAPSIGELPDLARVAIATSSEALRARREISPPAIDTRGAFKGLPELSGAQPVPADTIAAIVSAARSASAKAAGATEKVLPLLNRRFEAAEEEVNLLWWTFGEYSELSRKQFKELPDDAVACVAAIEFTSLLRIRCPLPSTRAILARVLQGRRSRGTTMLALAVPATLEVAGDDWVPDVEGHALLPVTSAARTFLDHHGEAVWGESLRSHWRIDPNQKVTNLDIAEQLCREILLLSAEPPPNG